VGPAGEQHTQSHTRCLDTLWRHQSTWLFVASRPCPSAAWPAHTRVTCSSEPCSNDMLHKIQGTHTHIAHTRTMSTALSFAPSPCCCSRPWRCLEQNTCRCDALRTAVRTETQPQQRAGSCHPSSRTYSSSDIVLGHFSTVFPVVHTGQA
jgi:hypothetical protein